jgi:hypothetical protein
MRLYWPRSPSGDRAGRRTRMACRDAQSMTFERPCGRMGSIGVRNAGRRTEGRTAIESRFSSAGKSTTRDWGWPELISKTIDTKH